MSDSLRLFTIQAFRSRWQQQTSSYIIKRELWGPATCAKSACYFWQIRGSKSSHHVGAVFWYDLMPHHISATPTSSGIFTLGPKNRLAKQYSACFLANAPDRHVCSRVIREPRRRLLSWATLWWPRPKFSQRVLGNCTVRDPSYSYFKLTECEQHEIDSVLIGCLNSCASSNTRDVGLLWE